MKRDKKIKKILIAGAGPSGASLAIRLAQKDFDVTLIEREKFPRHKLCGEFISPESFAHFEELNVLNEMFAIGGDRISETCFYSPSGKNVSVSSDWFGGDALSISRAAMDFVLLEKAKSLGVKVLEETQVVGLVSENEKVFGIKARCENRETKEIFADLIVDATGRANVLGKLIGKTKIQSSKFKVQGSKLVGFKTHLENVNLKKGVCEIYFFRGGYGGLSFVENGLANHCFLMKADAVKNFGGDANRIVEELVFENKRARETLKNSKPVFDWLAVSVDGFGAKNLAPAENLLAVGDAAAFIDPFTGSGMLMAFESAKILARSVFENQNSFAEIAREFSVSHRENFRRRLMICGIMRRAAFAPRLANLTISFLNLNRKMTGFLARATRPQTF